LGKGEGSSNQALKKKKGPVAETLTEPRSERTTVRLRGFNLQSPFERENYLP